MTDHENKKEQEAPTHGVTDTPGNEDLACPEIPKGMTLESLVDVTGEMGHLNELVMLHVEKSGGFTCTASYLAIVTPILDMLEDEIRFRYCADMTKEQLKVVIGDWITREIAGMQPENPDDGSKKGSE